MSRHSRNNTANSVFTYAEKKMLDKDYGIRSARIGQDSQRTFEQCHLCLNQVKDPVSCLQGHLFCKDCIMNNMLSQKKTIQNNQALYAKEKERDEMREFLKKRREDEKETKEFEKDSFELGALKKIKEHQKEFNIKSKFTEEDYENLEKKQVISQIKDKKTLGFDNHELKKELIQSSFWMAESSNDRIALLEQMKKLKADDKPKECMVCPGDNKHTLKLKDLFPLKFENGTFTCYASKKQLNFQKIVGLRTCGHTYIKDFFDKCAKSGGSCLCGKKFLEGDIISLQSANSAFCDHNQVEAKVYEPSFAI